METDRNSSNYRKGVADEAVGLLHWSDVLAEESVK